jgi:cytoskeletal protein RodZ
MSTHPLDRRRIRPFGRRFEPRRVAVYCGAILLVFAAAFAIGHMNRSDASVVERTPPPLPAVATPVPAALTSAPTIKLAVLRPPPAPRKSAPATSSQPTATSPTVTPAAPASTTPSPAPAPAPAPTVTQPASETPASKPSAPSTPSTPQHSSGGSGSGSGTSFESSG